MDVSIPNAVLAQANATRHVGFAVVDDICDLELLPEDVEARMGAEDPDMQALHQKPKEQEDAQKCQKTGMLRSHLRKGTGAPTELVNVKKYFLDELEEDTGKCQSDMPRVSSRKGTGAPSDPGKIVALARVGLNDEVSESDDEPDIAAEPRKRCQGRKGTGAPGSFGDLHSSNLVSAHFGVDLSKSEESSHQPIVRRPCRGRKGTRAPVDLGKAQAMVGGVQISSGAPDAPHEDDARLETGLRRSQGRKATDFPKVSDMQDDGHELSTDTSEHMGSEAKEGDLDVRPAVVSKRSSIWSQDLP